MIDLFSAWLVFWSIVTHSVKGTLIFLSRDENGLIQYSTFMSTIAVEVIALIYSFISQKSMERRIPNVRVNLSLSEILLMSIPAICSAIDHNLLYYILEIISNSLNIEVFKSTSIVFVGVASVLFLKRSLTRIHWASLLLLCTSVISIEVHTCPECSFSDFEFFPAFLSLLCSLFDGLAGVVTEWLMKRHRKMSTHQQNVWIRFWGVIVNIIACAMFGKPSFTHALSFHDFNIFAFLLIISQTIKALVTASILKYMNSVVESFISSFSLVTSTLFGGFVLGSGVEPSVLLAILSLCISMYLYETAPMATSVFDLPKQKRKILELESLPAEEDIGSVPEMTETEAQEKPSEPSNVK